MRDIRTVVIHRPGPAWRAGVAAFEQQGVQQHAEHWQRWFEAGKLVMGGPFVDEAGGGMMIAAAGVTREEIDAYARADPAVASRLLLYNLRPWLVAMS